MSKTDKKKTNAYHYFNFICYYKDSLPCFKQSESNSKIQMQMQ